MEEEEMVCGYRREGGRKRKRERERERGGRKRETPHLASAITETSWN